jgi:hypothetical protein
MWVNGIRDMLEDDVEHIHQIAANMEAQVSWMKDKSGQAHELQMYSK